MRYEIYNYKTGDTAGVSFPTKQQAQDWINRRKAETSLRLYWRVRRVKSNPRGRRTMRRSRNSSAKSKWGVYCRGTLAYVSASKPDTTKAKIKLKRAGFGVCTIKKVVPNPVSGKVPVVGWREQFKKASRVTGRGRRNPFTVGTAAGPAGVKKAVADLATRRTWIRPRTKPKYRAAPKERSRIVKGRRANPGRSFGPSARAVAGRLGRAVASRVRRNPAGFYKVWFSGPAGETAGVIVTTDKYPKGKTSIGTYSRLFPFSEAMKMRKIHVSKVYPSFEEAFAHDKGPASSGSGPRRSNPATYVLWKGNALTGYRVGAYEGTHAQMTKAQEALRKQGTATFVIRLSEAKKHQRQQMKGATLRGGPGGLRWRKNPRRAGVGTRSVMKGGAFRGAIGRRRSNPKGPYTLHDGTGKLRHTRGSLAEITKAAKILSEVRKNYNDNGYTEIRDADGKVIKSFVWTIYGVKQRSGNPRRRNAASILRRRANPSRTSARTRHGHVVYVGSTVAWVGRLARDAQKVMRKLIDAGYKSVKGFQAQLGGVKAGWRKQYRRAATAKRNPSGWIVKWRRPDKVWVSIDEDSKETAMRTARFLATQGRLAKVVSPQGNTVATFAVSDKNPRKSHRGPFSKAKLGSGKRHKACVRRMSRRKGIYDPEALCGSIGRRAYGARLMGKMSGAGRHRAAVRRHRRNPGPYWVTNNQGELLANSAARSMEEVKHIAAAVLHKTSVPSVIVKSGTRDRILSGGGRKVVRIRRK